MAFYWKPYVPVAKRRAQAARELAKRQKQGKGAASPVVINGRTIANTFWGKAWCDNLERYSDYENRLPRGRTYVRNGSVIDLQIKPGAINAVVSGSSLYDIKLKIAPVEEARWKAICADCAGAIDSLVELLQGKLSKGVMERICRQKDGLFPAPAEIKLSCSCPDGAAMCKHVAAVLYGVGARLDHKPELMFLLRGVNEKELIVQAAGSIPVVGKAPAGARVLGRGEDLGDLFGIEMGGNASVAPESEAKRKVTPKKSTTKKAGTKTKTKTKTTSKRGPIQPRKGAKG